MSDSPFKATHARSTAAGRTFLYKSSTERPGDSALVWCLEDWMWVISDNWDNEDLSNGSSHGFLTIPDLSSAYLQQVTCELLIRQYPEGHPQFTREDWRAEVQAENTELGYWMWVVHQLESE